MDDLTGAIIGSAMKVHRALGPGFLESVYQQALHHELRKNGHHSEKEKAMAVYYDDAVVGDFVADLIVDQLIILELKAVQKLAVNHEVQLVNYLKATGLDIGLVFNFGGGSLEFKRKFRTPQKSPSGLF